MSRHAAPAVVVGVDASTGSDRALTWAAATAAAVRSPLVLVHAYPDVSVLGSLPVFAPPESELAAQATDVLRQAEQRLRELRWCGPAPTRVAEPGAPADILVRESEGERMLVVGRRGRSSLVDMLIGSTAVAAADHGRVPVVVVPERWEQPGSEPGRVVLGIDGANTGDGAVDFAFATASRADVPLEAVHVCQAIDPYLPVEVFTREYGDWLAAEERLLAEQLAGWQEKYPDVAVHRHVVGGHPVGVLLSVAYDAQLLVVGGRAHGLGAFVGWVGRNLIHHAMCPVAIVHRS